MTDRDYQSPWTGVLGGCLGLALAVGIGLCADSGPWWGSRFSPEFWFLLVTVIVFVFMGAWDQVVVGRRSRVRRLRPAYHRAVRQLLRSALMRFVALAVFFLGVRTLYLHPLYPQPRFYEHFHDLVPGLYRLFLVGGFFYVAATLRWRGSRVDDLKDLALYLLLLSRAGGYSLRRTTRRHAWMIVSHKRTRIVFLGVLVQVIFIPMIAAVTYGTYHRVIFFTRSCLHPSPGGLKFFGALNIAMVQALILMDLLLSLGGYAFSLRWLNNKIRSVDLTLSGWLAAMLCYDPLYRWTSWALPFGDQTTGQIIFNPWALHLMTALTLCGYALYTGSTMAFGTRTSNLTHRGVIITNGLYAWVRHPGYVTENLIWWFRAIPFLGHIRFAISLLGWGAIYVLRALTEERHLRKDPAYVAYCEKVKYRFIPGVV